MSTSARKARKRTGIPFTKPQKVATPLEQRSFLTAPIRRIGDAIPASFRASHGLLAPRSPKRVTAFLTTGGRPRAYSTKGGEQR